MSNGQSTSVEKGDPPSSKLIATLTRPPRAHWFRVSRQRNHRIVWIWLQCIQLSSQLSVCRSICPIPTAAMNRSSSEPPWRISAIVP